jgi:hypothetical protein
MLDHVPHGQILDHERLVFPHESSTQLVQMVTAAVTDPGMDPSDPGPGLGPVPGTLVLAGQRTLGTSEPDPLDAFVTGLATCSPVDGVIRWRSPTSIPTAAVAAGIGAGTSWQRRDTNQRPAPSRDTVTLDGRCPSGSGRDHTMSNGRVISARMSRPSVNRNADAVNSVSTAVRNRSRRPFAATPIGCCCPAPQEFRFLPGLKAGVSTEGI